MSWLSVAYRLFLVVEAIVEYCVVQKSMFSKYIVLESSSIGFRNGFLLFFAGSLFSSFFFQAVGIARFEPSLLMRVC